MQLSVALATITLSIMEANAFVLPGTSLTFHAVPVTTIRKANPMTRSIMAPRPHSNSRRILQILRAASDTPPLPDTSDPFLILNLEPTSDKKTIKRAYKRMALKYHPDVRTNSNSSEEERRKANDDFARINSAYAFLSGKSDDRPSSTESEKKNGQAGSAGYGGYTPPHRRTGEERKSYSTDWQDYMPKYDEEEYNTNGDSFGSIFSDLFSEVSSSYASSSSSGGILNDFISFLEGNFATPGTAQEKEEDIVLDSLLKNGSLDEIRDEFDDAKLLVKQLEAKEIDLDSELLTVSKEQEAVGNSGTYMEGMRLEERRRELEARKEVVGDYLDRARMRQLKLRKRVEELRRDNDTSSGGKTRSQQSTGAGGNNGSESSTRSSSSSYTSADSSVGAEKTSGDDSWKRESFGSSGRRRGSGRSRASSRPSSRYTTSPQNSEPSTSTSNKSYSSASGTNTSGREKYARATSNPASSTSSTEDRSSQSNLPPHRRLTSSRYERNEADKRRLREIKVDEEIDKMKKELGL